jgi:predicted enzyme related to lactoylglutathione lyase
MRGFFHPVFPALVIALFASACTSTNSLPPIPTGEGAQHIPGKIVWHALLTDDTAGAKKFYGALCGWTFTPVAENTAYTTIRNEGRDVGTIIEVKDTQGMKITQWLSFMSVEDVDAAAALCKTAGSVLRGPMDVPQFGRVAVVKDALGAPLVLVKSLNGDPADGVEPSVGAWIWNDYVTTDVGQGAAFYGELVGYQTSQFDRDGAKDYWLLEGSGRERAGMFAAPEGIGANWVPYLRVDDAEVAMDKAATLGAKVLMEPNAEIRNGSSAVIQDPNGAVLVLQHYPF